MTEYSFPGMKTMMIIRERVNPTMKEVSDDLGVSSPAATAITERLFEDGEISRKEDPEDRRIVRVFLTPRGKTSLEKSLKIWHRVISERLSVLSKIERENLAKMLKKLAISS
jgi:DNA-binding MarR family transcriptional regulator